MPEGQGHGGKGTNKTSRGQGGLPRFLPRGCGVGAETLYHRDDAFLYTLPM